MGIKKQEYYEGAALHLLARTGKIAGLRYTPPFFVINDCTLVLLKYSTKNRSPWAFTFTADEQQLLESKAAKNRVVIALVCGNDGIAAFSYRNYLTIAPASKSALAISCRRLHREHYEVRGPVGSLAEKVPPANWLRILDN